MRHGKTLRAAAACAAAALSMAGATAAKADVHWNVTGTFDDGGTLSGTFDINVYGWLSDYDLTVTPGSNLTTGFEYTPDNSYWNNGAFYIDAEPGYFGSLRLTFEKRIKNATGFNAIVGGSPGPSWECRESWSCYVAQGGQTRYIADGHAQAEGFNNVPEPATWALMIAGFGLAGGALRSRRRVAA